MNADPPKPHFILAPMEGVVDVIVRDVLTSIGGIDQCVTEFIRVTGHLHSDALFYKYCPELLNGSRTAAGVPVAVQLLGGQAGPLAENAVRAAALGASSIDLNFGCPAKTVNRHDGGATLLKFPTRMHDILKTVRAAVPTHVPVTAKMRLGFDDPSVCIENAVAVAEAGIKTLTVHCRTKVDFYRPPAYWEWIPKIRARTDLNIVANGDIFTVEDFLRCREVSGSTSFMIGRGALANPFLFRQIKAALTDVTGVSEGVRDDVNDRPVWPRVAEMLLPYFDKNFAYRGSGYAVARTKQWLAQLLKQHPAARRIFDVVKVLNHSGEFRVVLEKLLLDDKAFVVGLNAHECRDPVAVQVLQS